MSVDEKGVVAEELGDAIASVNDTKNGLRNRGGYSPRQWVFGTNGRDPVPNMDNEHELAIIDTASRRQSTGDFRLCG